MDTQEESVLHKKTSRIRVKSAMIRSRQSARAYMPKAMVECEKLELEQTK